MVHTHTGIIFSIKKFDTDNKFFETCFVLHDKFKYTIKILWKYQKVTNIYYLLTIMHQLF